MNESHLHGIVTFVQERRFQLVDDESVAHLIVLAHDAPLDEAALEALARSGRRVTVTTQDDDTLIARVASDIAYARDITSIAEEPSDEADKQAARGARAGFS